MYIFGGRKLKQGVCTGCDLALFFLSSDPSYCKTPNHMSLLTRLLPAVVVVVIAVSQPCCQKSNHSSTPSVTATIGSYNFEATSAINFFSEAQHKFTFNLVMTASGDSSFLTLYFAPPPRLNVAYSTDSNYFDAFYSADHDSLCFDAG